ncbi:hypothetical protein LTR10_024325 [Elasticomyces elasticus]|uniref:NmrA-like domain-containing protein n=1 Tax=Exophiala sideris TaxID=1016849 RepID=A0ABR0IU75_9EURO|nr:hypothetical protein LTR10_024325 [Elasticomyces elasticus]KAK5020794.1 hypothetical protein LTS07_011430 [Exophiala sideris]KAK5022978.1 hypothetical protein LTR13_011379 [Exophiala sideris]KAK5048382.1 hypothetical protein LTR69_011421 [Exophiala sideris]KAK5175982.1 hypothetical protein LTR44_011459 [Eurotiomycetes sp. CCFEE 6388]
MAAIRRVALVGSGALGVACLEGLIKAGFKVTALTRSRTKFEKYSKDVEIKELEYLDPSSLAELKRTFEYQDAVVSVVAPAAIMAQQPLIEAAAEAGIKHIIPSTFASMGGDSAARHLPGYDQIHELQDWLIARSSRTQDTNRMTWTTVNNGAFMDLVLNYPFLADFPNHRATLWDSGDNKLSCTTYPTIARAVVGILRNYTSAACKNRWVNVHDIALSQNMVLDMAKKADPSSHWDVDAHLDTAKVLDQSLATYRAQRGSGNTVWAHGDTLVHTLLTSAVMSGRYKTNYEGDLQNEELGVPEFTLEDLYGLVTMRTRGEMV